MGRPISLFSDYHQRENSLTNFTGLVLKLIYEESPRQFEEALVTLLPEDVQLAIGPKFTQQIRQEDSVPDLLIQQKPFSLFFETKTNDWFYGDQLQRHIKGLSDETGVKVLFCLSNFEHDDPDARFAADITKATKDGVHVVFLSFEDLNGVFERLRLSNALRQTVDEFGDYLDCNGLLPRWKDTMDVPNCGKTIFEIEAGAYVCPNTGGSYSHHRARYFGSYRNKTTEYVAEIEGLVACDVDFANPQVRWKNAGLSDDKLIQRARDILPCIEDGHKRNLHEAGLQFFLLGELHRTDFKKDTPGGMQVSKMYFWNIARKVNATNAAELAERLRGRSWSEFR